MVKHDKEIDPTQDAEARTRAEAEARTAKPTRDERQVTVKFLTTVTTDEAQPRTFAEGSTATLPESSAKHWINRRAAEVTDEKDRDLHADVARHDAARGPQPKPAAPGERQVPEPLTGKETRATPAAHPHRTR